MLVGVRFRLPVTLSVLATPVSLTSMVPELVSPVVIAIEPDWMESVPLLLTVTSMD